MLPPGDLPAPGIPRRLLIGALLCACAGWSLALSGCVAAPPPESGICIGEETLEQIEPGKTREPWLRAVLGEPTSTSSISDEPGVTVLRYSTVQSAEGGLIGSVLGRPGERSVATIYFIVRDGIVERCWADRVQQDGGEKLDA